MNMPKPTEHHRKLQALAGQWSGQETLHPSPWAPDTRTAHGRFVNRMGLDGMFLINEYQETRDDKVFFRGHGVYGWDAEREQYTMFWFDSMGMSPNETHGTWEGQTLTFANSGPRGENRYVYELLAEDRMRFSIQFSPDGATWQTFMEGEYTRA